jgi:hypothetical protein
MEKRIQGMIVGALLEYEEISGVSGGVPRGRAQSVGGGATGVSDKPRSPTQLVDEFTYWINSLGYFGVDKELIVQIFRQVLNRVVRLNRFKSCFDCRFTILFVRRASINCY